MGDKICNNSRVAAVAAKAKYVVGKSRCPKCGRNSLVREKDGWEGAKPRIVCAYVGCLEVVSK
jgi:hypothetical protein